MTDLTPQERVVRFYEKEGWAASDAAGNTLDALLWEDLRPAAEQYVSSRRSLTRHHLPKSGNRLLDAGSGPIQYPEYLEYSRDYEKRVCVDIPLNALKLARHRIEDHGEFVLSSILELPFGDSEFDAVVSLHTIYHIAREKQETAVRSLLRVAKGGAPVVIVYRNPLGLFGLWKRIFRSANPRTDSGTLPFFAFPLEWWREFSDVSTVRIFPWRSLTAKQSKVLIPNSRLGAQMFEFVAWIEATFPAVAVRFGAYCMFVLTKK